MSAESLRSQLDHHQQPRRASNAATEEIRKRGVAWQTINSRAGLRMLRQGLALRALPHSSTINSRQGLRVLGQDTMSHPYSSWFLQQPPRASSTWTRHHETSLVLLVSTTAAKGLDDLDKTARYIHRHPST